MEEGIICYGEERYAECPHCAGCTRLGGDDDEESVVCWYCKKEFLIRKPEGESLLKQIELLKGAIAAQDSRELLAGIKCGVPYEEHGCDWPDAVADKVLELRK
jgi:hypothetical protein